MTRYLTLAEVLRIHTLVLRQSGGSGGTRDLSALESAVARPQATFGGTDLYDSLVTKAAALAQSIVLNHPFVDGNKRVGHAAMETFLYLNGYALDAPVNEQERVFLSLAAGELDREHLAEWIERHLVPLR